ncbi:hypothetical protein KEM55_000295, partial [Ascosphaera atra]
MARVSTDGPGGMRRKPGPASKTGGMRPSRKSLDQAARIQRSSQKDASKHGRTKTAARRSIPDEDIE